MKEGSCKYLKSMQSLARSPKAYATHDIEDLCSWGKTYCSCPYFVSRQWSQSAEVIFAPYNYILDPVIQRAMEVDIQDAIIILDEAHNIEDTCRDGASLEVEMSALMELQLSLQKAIAFNGLPDTYEPLFHVVGNIVKWLETKEKLALKDGFNNNYMAQGPWESTSQGKALLTELSSLGFGAEKVDELWEMYQTARSTDEELNQRFDNDKEKKREVTTASSPPAGQATRVGASNLGLLSRIITIIRLLHHVSVDGGRDYRLVARRLATRNRSNLKGGTHQGREEEEGPDWEMTFNLWCLNPAVAFKPVSDAAHAVILTSGTLSPLEGFASELGADFPVRFEAGHVVNMQRQVWAGVLGVGPNGAPLQATFKHVSDQCFQDSLGQSILLAAKKIPDGLLVFFPSYALLDKLMLRWKTTGLLKRLNNMKKTVVEPRSGGNDVLQNVMNEYYSSVASGRGAMMLAVCRGKVSEGLDFADANARGVIVVGIPFPNVKDNKVNLKKAYNDAGHGQGLLSGDAWYSQQAFRALNQAVGRCIRHRKDWGAILLLDDRFYQPRNTKNMSRWLRGAIVSHRSYDAAMASMESFFWGVNQDVTLTTDAKHIVSVVQGVAYEAISSNTNSWEALSDKHVLLQPDSLTFPTAIRAQDKHVSPLLESWTPAAAVGNLPIHQWIECDLKDYIRYITLQEIDISLYGAESLAHLAAAGIIDCFVAAAERLHEGGKLLDIASEWASCLPRGLQVLLAIEGGTENVDDRGISEAASMLMALLPLKPKDYLGPISKAYSQSLSKLISSNVVVTLERAASKLQHQTSARKRHHEIDDDHAEPTNCISNSARIGTLAAAKAACIDNMFVDISDDDFF